MSGVHQAGSRDSRSSPLTSRVRYLEIAMSQLLFEWDEDKARGNEAKHGVSFDEGKTIFNDPFSITISDPDHSANEDRWIDMGMSVRGRLLVLWYTDRGEAIRIIGCRQASKIELKAYENDRKR